MRMQGGVQRKWLGEYVGLIRDQKEPVWTVSTEKAGEGLKSDRGRYAVPPG